MKGNVTGCSNGSVLVKLIVPSLQVKTQTSGTHCLPHPRVALKEGQGQKEVEVLNYTPRPYTIIGKDNKYGVVVGGESLHERERFPAGMDVAVPEYKTSALSILDLQTSFKDKPVFIIASPDGVQSMQHLEEWVDNIASKAVAFPHNVRVVFPSTVYLVDVEDQDGVPFAPTPKEFGVEDMKNLVAKAYKGKGLNPANASIWHPKWRLTEFFGRHYGTLETPTPVPVVATTFQLPRPALACFNINGVGRVHASKTEERVGVSFVEDPTQTSHKYAVVGLLLSPGSPCPGDDEVVPLLDGAPQSLSYTSSDSTVQKTVDLQEAPLKDKQVQAALDSVAKVVRLYDEKGVVVGSGDARQERGGALRRRQTLETAFLRGLDDLHEANVKIKQTTDGLVDEQTRFVLEYLRRTLNDIGDSMESERAGSTWPRTSDAIFKDHPAHIGECVRDGAVMPPPPLSGRDVTQKLIL